MKNFYILLTSLLMTVGTFAQTAGFTIKSKIPAMKDGIVVGLVTAENLPSQTLAEDTVRNGQFLLRGRVSHPTLCTLITNNLSLLPPDNQDTSKIHWTYTTILVSNTDMTFEALHYDSISSDGPIGNAFKVSGGSAQDDLNTYNMQLWSKYHAFTPAPDSVYEAQMTFIQSHPHSVVSLMFANDMIQGEPRPTKKEIIALSKMIQDVPDDVVRLTDFRKNCIEAQKTAVNEKLQNLALYDMNGKSYNLVDVVPKGKYVLVDFWASWCGICRAALPDIKKLAKKYASGFVVVGISDDRKKADWLGAVKKEQLTWKQYQLTPQGSKDLLEKYLIRGVPYYLIVNPDGVVVTAPSHVEDMDAYLGRVLK